MKICGGEALNGWTMGAQCTNKECLVDVMGYNF
jgi:hypothetical protein